MTTHMHNEDIFGKNANNINTTKKGAKQEYAYQFIKNAIMDNRYKIGQKLNEVTLCEEMGGISRTPVRDALQRLYYEGFIENVPGRGMFVANIRVEELVEITEVRTPIEKTATELFIDRSTDDEKLELCKALAAHKKAFAEQDSTQIYKNDDLFHHIIYVGSHNSRLSNLLDNITELTSREAHLSYADMERVKKSIEEHEKILNAILCGDKETAVEATREHRMSWLNFMISTQLNLNYLKAF